MTAHVAVCCGSCAQACVSSRRSAEANCASISQHIKYSSSTSFAEAGVDDVKDAGCKVACEEVVYSCCDRCGQLGSGSVLMICATHSDPVRLVVE